MASRILLIIIVIFLASCPTVISSQRYDDRLPAIADYELPAQYDNPSSRMESMQRRFAAKSPIESPANEQIKYINNGNARYQMDPNSRKLYRTNNNNNNNSPPYPVQGFSMKSPPKPKAKSGCVWYFLDHFKRMNMELGEITVNDISGLPCYKLKLMGFVKWTDMLYFPLKNFRATHLNKAALGYPNDGASFDLPLNCSLPPLGGQDFNPNTNDRLILPVRPKAQQIFNEQIIVAVDCGFLNLNLLSDGYSLALNSISLHLDPDTEQRPNENVLFASRSSRYNPLLKMPIDYKYECFDRVVLEGNSSIQLFLERFELERSSSLYHLDDKIQSRFQEPLQWEPRLKETPSVMESQYATNSYNSKQRNSLNYDKTFNARYATMKRDASLFESEEQKVPSQGSTREKVLRCPRPSSPLVALDSMVDWKEFNGDTVLGRLMMFDGYPRSSAISSLVSLESGILWRLAISLFIMLKIYNHLRVEF